MYEWITQHDVTLETSRDAGACSLALDASGSRAGRSTLGSRAATCERCSQFQRTGARFAEDSPVPGLFGSSFQAMIERRFASTTLPREAQLPRSFSRHSCLRASGFTYVERQLAYTVSAGNRSCCVIPRGQRFEHLRVQRSAAASSRSATAVALATRRASPYATRHGGAAI
jgi:hypothetical protein